MNKTGSYVLIVDDDPVVRETLQETLQSAGFTTRLTGDGKSALDLLHAHSFDLMLLDLELPRVSGLEVAKQSLHENPNMPIIIVSGKGTIRSAVEATRLGVYDFLEKPTTTERILLTLRNALEKAALQNQRDRLLQEIRDRYQMVGGSPAMQKVYALVDKAAALKTSKVLIFGESGTGKELVARAIHHNSKKSSGPFVPVNCAAIPEELIESELFGHEKGAFTGANRTFKGKFEQAHKGTLFLDELGDMSLMTQAKILRALEENAIYRIGSEKAIPVETRIVAATNKQLETEIAEGNFREDLYYRLNIVPITLPPLRERKEDIPLLVEHFIRKICHKNGLPVKEVDPGALHVLVQSDWPGNVRQLRNVVERLIVLADSEVVHASVVQQALTAQYPVEKPASFTTLRRARENFEKTFIHNALIANEWKIEQTAQSLGIDRAHLWRKMKQLDISNSG